MFLLVIWQWRILRGRSFATVTGKGYSPERHQARPVALGDVRFCILFFIVTVVLPVGQLAGRLVLQVLRLLSAGTC